MLHGLNQDVPNFKQLLSIYPSILETIIEGTPCHEGLHQERVLNAALVNCGEF